MQVSFRYWYSKRLLFFERPSGRAPLRAPAAAGSSSFGSWWSLSTLFARRFASSSVFSFFEVMIVSLMLVRRWNSSTASTNCSHVSNSAYRCSFSWSRSTFSASSASIAVELSSPIAKYWMLIFRPDFTSRLPCRGEIRKFLLIKF